MALDVSVGFAQFDALTPPLQVNIGFAQFDVLQVKPVFIPTTYGFGGGGISGLITSINANASRADKRQESMRRFYDYEKNAFAVSLDVEHDNEEEIMMTILMQIAAEELV